MTAAPPTTALVLIRHAKSDWGRPSLDDHDRPLNSRGLRDAPVLAKRLARELQASGIVLGALLASTALRARTTAEIFGAELGVAPELDSELYGAPASRLLSAATKRGVGAVAVVAHDPGMTVLAERLSGGGIGHMPTCAVATFRWRAAEWDVATATDPDSWTFDAPGASR